MEIPRTIFRDRIEKDGRNKTIIYETDIGDITLDDMAKLFNIMPKAFYGRYRRFGPGNGALFPRATRGEGSDEWRSMSTRDKKHLLDRIPAPSLLEEKLFPTPPPAKRRYKHDSDET